MRLCLNRIIKTGLSPDAFLIDRFRVATQYLLFSVFVSVLCFPIFDCVHVTLSE